jgi:hypothetical protein
VSPAATVERVRIERVRVEGGVIGIEVVGLRPGGQEDSRANVFFDEIAVVGCYSAAGAFTSQFSPEARIHVGNRGYGNRVRILGNSVLYSADVGIEVNAFEDVLVEGNTVSDVLGQAYYFTHYNGAVDTTKQRIVYRNNRANRTRSISGNQSFGRSFTFNTDGGGYDLGHIVLENNSSYIQASDFHVLGYALHVVATRGHGIKSLDVKGFSTVCRGFVARGQSSGNPIAMRISTGAVPSTVSISELRMRVEGAVSGSKVSSFVGLEISGSPVTFEVDDAVFDLTVRGMPAFGLRGIMIGQASGSWNMTGEVRRAAFRTFRGDRRGQAIKVRNSSVLTISHSIRIVDCDFRGLNASSQAKLAVDDAFNTRKVTLVNSKRGADAPRHRR